MAGVRVEFFAREADGSPVPVGGVTIAVGLPRAGECVTLPNGRVLLVGGVNWRLSAVLTPPTIEILLIDPAHAQAPAVPS